jgi:hypothetical protein
MKDETPGTNTRGSDEEPAPPTDSESNTPVRRQKSGVGFVAFDREASRRIRAKLPTSAHRDVLTELMLRVDHVTHDLPVTFGQLAQYCRITRQKLSRLLPLMEEEEILEVHRGTNDDDVSVFKVLCYAELSPVAGNKSLQPPAYGGTRGGTRGGNKVVPLNTPRAGMTRSKKYQVQEEGLKEDRELNKAYLFAAQRGLEPNMAMEELQELMRKEGVKG